MQAHHASDLDQSVSSANSALSPPPPHSKNSSGIRDSSHLSAPLQSPFPSPGASSRSAAGSPGRPTSAGNRSVALYPPSTFPVLPKYRGALDSSTTSPEDKRAESSIYYTTAWGSPYAAPSPRSISQAAGADRDSADSSPVSIEFGLEPNRPHIVHNLNQPERHVPAGSDGGFGRSPERDRAGRERSIQDFTQDWINQYLSGQPRTERSNWLSDDSGSEAPSFITAANNFADDASDDWLGLEQDSRDQDLLKTPTLADFVSRKAAAKGATIRSKVKETFHKRTDTLRQEDFWGFAYDKDPQPLAMADTKETQPTEVEQKPLAADEKPLPPPPVDEKSTPANEASGSTAGVDVKEKSNTSSPLPQKKKKKIPWRGKGCIIDLPVFDKRGTEESGYRLLTADDVRRGMQQWEELGYDVRGFNVSASEDPYNFELGGASRPPFPDLVDMQDEIKPEKYKVRFPNKALWDDYVNHLQEEKLRALGVFGGDEEPQPSPSPASGLNNMTPFPGLVSSPPLPTGSAASNTLSMPHPFSPQITQGGNLNGVSSLASPAFQFGVQTPSYGVDQGIMPQFLPFQPTPSAQSSLTPQSFINMRQSGPTSTIPGTLSNLTSMLSPVSPLNDQNTFHPGFGDQRQQKDGFDDHTHQLQEEYAEDLRPLRTPPPNPDNFHASTVEIAQPTPRGHSRGHNLSETLQRGIDQVEPDYHLEDSIDRELDEGDYDPVHHNLGQPGLLNSRWALPESRAPQDMAQHLNHFYGDSYHGNAAQEGSDIDTNPSLSGTPHNQHIPWHEPKPSSNSYAGGHQSKLSTSSLNVAAKEFAPTDPAAPQQFPFTPQSSFQFPKLDNSVFTFGAGANDKPAGGLNVAAPSFTPGKPNAETDDGQDKSREFKFSVSSNASMNVAAPEFSPGRTKIFGDIDLSEISKTTKKSKAIPIVRPDEDKERERENAESKEGKDDRGRPVPTDRHKRARRVGGDGSDGEARFSISHPLGEANNFQAQQPLNASHAPAAGKENASPDQDTNAPQSQKDAPVERKNTPLSEASTWASENKAEDAKSAENKAEPNDIQHKGAEVSAEDKPAPKVAEGKPAEQAKQEPAKVSEPVQFGQKSAFSGAAKPFSFKPSIAEFVPFNAEPPKPPPKDTPPKETKGLMASRYAAASPPSSPPTHQLSTELTASAKEDTKDKGVGVKEGQTHIDDDQDSLDEGQLNAIMDQLNEDSDVGIERISTPKPANDLPEAVQGPSKEKRHVQADNRSEPPSPSPGRGAVSNTLDVPKLDFDKQSQFSATPTKGFISNTHSPVRQLLSRNEQHISDWDDVISSGEDVKLKNRSKFFDRRINELVGSAIDQRLNPLEHALSSIQHSLSVLSSGPSLHTSALRSTSAEIVDSDADDEDDEYEEDASDRARSPLHQRDRKFEKLKNVVLDALASRETQPPQEQPATAELLQLRNSVADLHSLTSQNFSQEKSAGLRQMIQDVVAGQINLRSRSDAEEIGADSLMLQINSLKDMLRGADERTENEYKKRRQAQDTIAQLQRLLKNVEEEAVRHSTAAESAEARLLQFQEEKMPYYQSFQQKASALEKERESTRLTLDELSTKNITLQGTLDEYRFTCDSAKRETEEANARLEEAQANNHHLRNTVASMKMRIEDGLQIRQNLSGKMECLQDQMAALTGDISRDQAAWRRKEEEAIARYNELRASHNRETKLREQLESEVTKLEEQEREAAKLKFVFGQSQQENARLEELISDLKQKNQDLDLKASHFEREFSEARESSRVEIQRTRTSLETDLEAANTQVNIVRAELEAQIVRLQTQIDNVKLDSDTSRERYEMLLEEAQENRVSAVASAIESREYSMDEHRKLHERVLNDLRERHARALHNSSEDRQRTESYLMERLEFTGEKNKYMQDQVLHLEERLEIAQSAARAAASAAQSAKSETPTEPSHSITPSLPLNQVSSVPEKISPQALRESILVLQDQLQQRETRIDELENEVSSVDKEAPNKVKDRDTEINWLRELLGVRLDDLQDIINTLSQPSFNQQAVRDAAIRLKANLQMQQQEKERAMHGQSFPHIPSLSEITASPRALPLAAAAAWGNWRKAKENSNTSDQTPSKSSPASTFLSGLLTPPSSNARQPGAFNNAAAGPSWKQPPENRPLKSFDTTPRPLSSRAAGKMREPPTTPPLLRKSSYDHDAEPAEYAQSSLEAEGEGEGEEDESTADGFVSASPKEMADGPFGPQIA